MKPQIIIKHNLNRRPYKRILIIIFFETKSIFYVNKLRLH